MKVKEIRALSAAEMDEKVVSLKEELFNLRFQHATGQLENPMRIREVKKTIARIKTVQREAELKAQNCPPCRSMLEPAPYILLACWQLQHVQVHEVG